MDDPLIAKQLDLFLAAADSPNGPRATPAQISFIQQLQEQIEELGGDWEAGAGAEDLSVAEASEAIDELKLQRTELQTERGRRGGWGRR